MERKADFLLSDDPHVRKVASEKELKIIGTVGVLANAKLKGIIPNLKNLLDTLIKQGFRLNPAGLVYKDALRKVGEL